jgi:hypothetical protein
VKHEKAAHTTGERMCGTRQGWAQCKRPEWRGASA